MYISYVHTICIKFTVYIFLLLLFTFFYPQLGGSGFPILGELRLKTFGVFPQCCLSDYIRYSEFVNSFDLIVATVPIKTNYHLIHILVSNVDKTALYLKKIVIIDITL